MKRIILALTLAATALMPMTTTVSAREFTAQELREGRAELRRLFKTHYFSGKRLGPLERAATGDPSIGVFDKRRGFSRPAVCSYINTRGKFAKRAIVCENL